LRILLAAAVWLIFTGGTALYMAHRDVVAEISTPAVERSVASGVYALRITPSFIAEKDPFALDIDDDDGAALLTARLGGREIVSVTSAADARAEYVVEPLEGVRAGENEIYVYAASPADRHGTYNALRAVVTRDGLPVAEKTIWSAPGETVAGSVTFDAGADIDRRRGPKATEEENARP
jgi:hypothetical protein